MENRNEKRSEEVEKGQPGELSSFNQHEENKTATTQNIGRGKDESESYGDYNGNSEQNAPVKDK